MKNLTLFFFLAWLCACSSPKQQISFQTNSFQLVLNEQGFLTQLLDPANQTNYLANDTLAPLLTIQRNGQTLFPLQVSYLPDQRTLQMQFPENILATIRIQEKQSHLVFELTALSPPDQVDLVTWGPYPTTISQTIGETVGVVRDSFFAIGIQSLNPKTLGGYPWNDNDCMPQIDIFESGNFSDVSEKGKREVLYRVEAAKPTEFGSTLQAYCRNRHRERVTANWGAERYTIPTFDDGGVIGSKIALFGCATRQALPTLEQIELAEGLPHPTIDGQWGKTARSANAAYMILDFGEKDINQAIQYTKQAGLRYLYHGGPFKTWGHFVLNEQFPSGWDGLKNCVEKAREAGLYVGVHTLSNFITTNDAYVTPVPDPRLATVGVSQLVETVNPAQSKISIADPGFFNQYGNNNLKTVRIGKELVRYGSVSDQAPWQLLDCQRGAFGTQAQEHAAGDSVSMLADHAYKVFLTNPELTLEMSAKLTELFNYCGLRQISFDGVEGNRSTGMGNYGEILFTTTWYNNLREDLRAHYIADASRTTHYFWHIYSRMNWGEPWYAGFRESQTEYRLKNQPYFKRNYMPAMLGWFSLRPETSLEDIEWMLARSAGFDAGFGFVCNYEVLEKNGQSAAILAQLGNWEKARMANVFSDTQKERMQDIQREFRLKSTGENQWDLYEFHSFKFRHEAKVRQPGEPLYSTFSFENPTAEQPIQFIITAENANLNSIQLELDNFKTITLPVQLKKGESLRYEGGDQAVFYSSTWQKIREVPLNAADFLVKNGKHRLQFDCQFSASGEKPAAKIEVRLQGPGEEVK